MYNMRTHIPCWSYLHFISQLHGTSRGRSFDIQLPLFFIIISILVKMTSNFSKSFHFFPHHHIHHISSIFYYFPSRVRNCATFFHSRIPFTAHSITIIYTSFHKCCTILHAPAFLLSRTAARVRN